MDGNQILKFIMVFSCIFHYVICYINSISTNEETYGMVAFECGSDYYKVPIDVFVANSTLWNDHEIDIDHFH
jgi:hypothetical protein